MIKKNYSILLMWAMIAMWGGIQAQEVEVFKSNDMVFYGLDFSKARFTGGSGLTSPATMQDKYMPALNELMIDERRRYDVAKSYQKKNVEYYFNMADQRNAEIDIYQHYKTEAVKELSKDTIEATIQQYVDVKHEGLGLVYVVDEVDHSRNLIILHIVFFDIENQKVLLIKRARGNMKGFSIRNYYAGGIRQIIKDTEKYYLDWD